MAPLFVTCFLIAGAVAGCSKDDPAADNDAFDTLQACYDEHHGEESLPIQKAIVTCCLDHPIGGQAAPTCLTTAADCTTHVRGLLDASIADADISAACTEYIRQKMM
ncbi:MAG TPA: hypothetical protein VHW23_34100 [Kofleriaceae bacterium]|jgi:hypothetical protein|nr:hypothetical protein [Kofleriaceae bacterium]